MKVLLFKKTLFLEEQENLASKDDIVFGRPQELFWIRRHRLEECGSFIMQSSYIAAILILTVPLACQRTYSTPWGAYSQLQYEISATGSTDAIFAH
jgi:hypothetical protein